LSVAEIVAISVEVIVPLAAVNAPVFEPGSRVTETGTLSEGRLLEREIVVQAVAALLRETVHPVEVLLERLAGEQVTDVSRSCVLMLRDVLCELPFALAVRVAEVSALTRFTAAVNVLVDWPVAIFTVAGGVTAGLLEVMLTLIPFAGAAPDRVTAQLAVPGAFTVFGEQAKALIETVPDETRFTEADWLMSLPELFHVPVTVAIEFDERFPVLTVNVDEL
jgi:hypothetical protein